MKCNMGYPIWARPLASPPLKPKIGFSKIMCSVFLQLYHPLGNRVCWPRLCCSNFRCTHTDPSWSGLGVERSLGHPGRDLIRCYSLGRRQYIPLRKDGHPKPKQNKLPRGNNEPCLHVLATQKSLKETATGLLFFSIWETVWLLLASLRPLPLYLLNLMHAL
jgi:hypothetical protein